MFRLAHYGARVRIVRLVEEACAPLVPEGPRRIAGGKLAVGERRPRTGTRKMVKRPGRAPGRAPENDDSPEAPVLAFAPF
jgi:hypothetical protein